VGQVAPSAAHTFCWWFAVPMQSHFGA